MKETFFGKKNSKTTVHCNGFAVFHIVFLLTPPAIFLNINFAIIHTSPPEPPAAASIR